MVLHGPKIDNLSHEYFAKLTTFQPHSIPKPDFILHRPPSGPDKLANNFIFPCYSTIRAQIIIILNYET